jgi:hypothetical protein
MIRLQPHSAGQQTRGWLAAVILLASSGWAGLPVARAGCSHLVTMKTDSTRSKVTRMDHLDSVTALLKDLSQALPIDRHSVPPCSGFLCSGSSIPLTPIVFPDSVPRIDAWSRFDFREFTSRAWSSPFASTSDLPQEKNRVERLIRPPRSLRMYGLSIGHR